jgi:regulator of RNase E activity RraA
MSKGKITPKNILHQHKKKNNPITLDNLLEKASSNNVADAMKNLYGKHGLIKDIKPINPSYKVVGRVRTVKTNSNDWGTGIKAIYASEPGEILFIDCSDCENAIWGELASQAAKKYGISATIINGASRDTGETLKTGFKLFSKDTMSNAGHPLNEGTINERLVIDDNVIINGDIVVADRDGVIIIPQENVDEVIKEVNNIKKFESDCVKQIIEQNAQLDKLVNIN